MLIEQTSRVPRRLAAGLFALLLCTLPLLSTGDLRAAPRKERLEAAKERLYELEKDFELVVERYNATNEELDEIQAEISATRLVVEKLQGRMDSRQDDAVALAQELYMAGGSVIAFESILSARSIAELETTLEYLQASEQSHAKVFEELSVDRAELNRNLVLLEEDRERAVATEARLAELREDIEAKVADQQDEITELNAAIEAAERRRAEARREAAEAAAAAAAPAAPLSIPARPAPAPNAGAQTAVDAALSQVGKPYQWGAEGPDSYDCSGLTLWAWAHAGVSLPHNSGMQQAAIPPVSRDDLQPGDLLFYGSPVHHVSMYIGNGQMVEAPYTGAYVRVVSADRWSDFAGAGRPGV